jgi:3-phytase
VVTERLQHRLRIFRVTADGVSDVTGRTQIVGEGDAAAPMGISLYRRPGDGAIFAIVAPKTGPRTGYLSQYRLEADGAGQVNASFVRSFGRFSGTGEIEAVAVDDAPGIRLLRRRRRRHSQILRGPGSCQSIGKSWRISDSPDSRLTARESRSTPGMTAPVTYFVQTNSRTTANITCTGERGEPGRPHDHSKLLKIVRGGADSTDGLEVSSRPLGAQFPKGMMVAMNSGGRNFLLYRWEDISKLLEH